MTTNKREERREDGKCAPCAHGELCRAYIRRFGHARSREVVKGADGSTLAPCSRVTCIYSQACPDCEFYEPKED